MGRKAKQQNNFEAFLQAPSLHCTDNILFSLMSNLQKL